MRIKITHLLAVLVLVFALFAAAQPASADSGLAWISGTISAVDTGGLTITPRQGGSDVTLTVDSTTTIKRSGNTVTLADLKVGDKVTASYDSTTKLAKSISARPDVTILTGTVSAVDATASTVTVTPKKGGAAVVLTVDASTRITRSGKTAVLAGLQQGDKVTVTYDRGSMLALKIYARPDLVMLFGTVSAVDTTASTVSVTPHKGGTDMVLKVDSSTNLRLNGKTAALADLKVGYKVNAVYNRVSLLAEKVFARKSMATVSGSISAVDATAGTVTVTPKTGEADVTLKIDATTKISLDGKTATVTDLQVGDLAQTTYDPATMVATRLMAETPFIMGKISTVDSAAGTLSITPMKGGTAVSLTVDSATVIQRNHASATLADLKVGNLVSAQYNPVTMLALKIRVLSGAK